MTHACVSLFPRCPQPRYWLVSSIRRCTTRGSATTMRESPAWEAARIWGRLWALTRANGRAGAPSGSATFTVIPRCSPPDLVQLWCGHSSSPLRRRLPVLRPVALHQGSNPCLVRLTVELGQEIVRAQLVEIAPPSTSSVVPDPVTTRDASGNIASPAHIPPFPAPIVPCSNQPPRRVTVRGLRPTGERVCNCRPTCFPTVVAGRCGGFYLRSWAAGQCEGMGLWSRLNVRERCYMRRKLRRWRSG